MKLTPLLGATALALALALGSPAALAWSSEITLSGVVKSQSFAPTVSSDFYGPVISLHEPADVARGVNYLQSAASDGGRAQGLFVGRIGMLKAMAGASYVYCCSIKPEASGFSDAEINGSFMDTLNVTSATLAVGTPVRYTLRLHISGTIDGPSFEMGGSLQGAAAASAWLSDRTNGEAANVNWSSQTNAPGFVEVSVNTAVGHQLVIEGRLNVMAYVAANAVTARSVVVDYSHSAGYQLVTSVAGVNTVGASGYDFATAPVPEPGSWALMAAGLLLVGLRRRARR